MTCSNGMSGHGDMTFEADTYAGTMTMSSPQGEMQMKMFGRRVGDCDASETLKSMAQAKTLAEEVRNAPPPPDPMIQACDGAARGLQSAMFLGPNALCKTPEQKAAFCKTLASEEGYDHTAHGGNGVQELARLTEFCGTTPDALKQDLCAKAVAAESLRFMGGNCPAEAKSYAVAHCAGRKFTSIPEENVRSFCVTFAQQLLAEDGQKDGTTPRKRPVKSLIGR